MCYQLISSANIQNTFATDNLILLNKADMKEQQLRSSQVENFKV